MQRATLLTLACAACLISLSQARTMPWAMAPSPAPEGNATCPPPGLAPVDEFDVDEYISESWYVLAQTPLVYQPVNQLFCVTATYVPVNETDPLEGLTVVNFNRRGGVTGQAISTSAPGAPTLRASVPDRSRPSELAVGFDFPGQSQLVGTQFGDGPYWVIALGSNDDGKYEWAIVSSGAPSVPTDDGCTYAEAGVAGLWLFSREPESEDNYNAMMAELADLGVDTTDLVKVQHKGCTYE